MLFHTRTWLCIRFLSALVILSTLRTLHNILPFRHHVAAVNALLLHFGKYERGVGGERTRGPPSVLWWVEEDRCHLSPTAPVICRKQTCLQPSVLLAAGFVPVNSYPQTFISTHSPALSLASGPAPTCLPPVDTNYVSLNVARIFCARQGASGLAKSRLVLVIVSRPALSYHPPKLPSDVPHLVSALLQTGDLSSSRCLHRSRRSHHHRPHTPFLPYPSPYISHIRLARCVSRNSGTRPSFMPSRGIMPPYFTSDGCSLGLVCADYIQQTIRLQPLLRPAATRFARASDAHALQHPRAG